MSRDQNGRLMWAGAKAIQHVGSAIECEAEAIRWAVATLSGFGYRRVIFESDSLTLCRMIREEEEVWPLLSPILQSITHMLKSNPEFRVEYGPREGNKVADRIAKESSSSMNHVPKLYSVIPMWLKDVVEADMPMEFVNSW